MKTVNTVTQGLSIRCIILNSDYRIPDSGFRLLESMELS